MNLALHHQDFGIEAGWTFSSSGHGKSPCDGLGAVVKSSARKYLLKHGPEAAFTSAKDFYQYILEKMNRSMSSTTYMRRSIPNTNAIDIDINDSSDEEVSEILSRPTRSIEVRWLDEEYVEETFQKVLKSRWSNLSTKGNACI